LGTDDGVRTLLVFASNIAVSAPHHTHIAERLAQLDCLVVSGFVLSETAALADVVLPCTQWAEEEGTLANLEGRVLLRRQALGPPPGVRSDLQTLHALAQRLGCPTSFPEAPREVFDELRAASAGGMADYAGITYERIASRLDEAMQQSVDAYRDPGQERAQPVTEGQFRRSHRREVGDLPTAQPRVPLGRRPVHHR
jgi:assimilatory nitrate reductase catalytic subunit